MKRINLNSDGTEYTFEGYESVLKMSLLTLEDVSDSTVSITKMELKNQKPAFIVQSEKGDKITFRNHYKTIAGANKKFNSLIEALN